MSSWTIVLQGKLDQLLSERPQLCFVFLITLLGLVLVPASVVLSLLLIPVFIHNKRVALMGCLFGILLALLMWGIDAISLIHIHQLNMMAASLLFHGYIKQSISMCLFLDSLPLAIVIAGSIALLLTGHGHVASNLKRVAAGRHIVNKGRLSEKQIAKAMAALSDVNCSDGSILGVSQSTGKPIILNDKAANHHTLAVGTTGSGKTTAILNIIDSVIARNMPLIYVDGKGDSALAKRIEAKALKAGRKFYLFSMVGDSVCYNPIASGGITSKKDRIVELREWSEDHYRKIAEGYLQTVFMLLERFKVKVDLVSLARYMQPDTLFDLARKHKDAEAVRVIERLEGQQRDISSLIAEVQNIANSEIGHLFNGGADNVLMLEKALAENAIVYFCLQPLKFPAYAELVGKLIINDIKALAANQLESDQKTKLYTIFDEFSIFAGDQIVNLINQGRSAGIHAVLSTQSLSDITKKGGDALLGQVVNNCNNYLIMRQNHHADAEMMAQIIGTRDTFEVTSQVDQNAKGGAGSVRETKTFIVHPDEIKRLGCGEAVWVKKQNFSVKKVLIRK